jgi:chromosome segregation ATPase
VQPREFVARLSPNVFGLGIAVCGIAVILGQVYGLKALLELDGDRQNWNASESTRQSQLASLERTATEMEAHNTQAAKRLGEARAELSNAQSQRDRVVGELAESQRALELARAEAVDAERTRLSAMSQSQLANDARIAAEERTKALELQESKLQTGVYDLKQEFDQLKKSLDSDQKTLEKLSTEIARLRKQIDDGNKQVDSNQARYREQQTRFIKESQDLEAALAERNKVMRKREEMLADVNSADQRVTTLKNQEQLLTTGNFELTKINMELATSKADFVNFKGKLQASLAELQKQIGTTTTEYEARLKKLAEARAEEKRLQDAIQQLSEKMSPKDSSED